MAKSLQNVMRRKWWLFTIGFGLLHLWIAILFTLAEDKDTIGERFSAFIVSGSLLFFSNALTIQVADHRLTDYLLVGQKVLHNLRDKRWSIFDHAKHFDICITLPALNLVIVTMTYCSLADLDFDTFWVGLYTLVSLALGLYCSREHSRLIGVYQNELAKKGKATEQ